MNRAARQCAAVSPLAPAKKSHPNNVHRSAFSHLCGRDHYIFRRPQRDHPALLNMPAARDSHPRHKSSSHGCAPLSNSRAVLREANPRTRSRPAPCRASDTRRPAPAAAHGAGRHAEARHGAGRHDGVRDELRGGRWTREDAPGTDRDTAMTRPSPARRHPRRTRKRARATGMCNIMATPKVGASATASYVIRVISLWSDR